MSQRRAVEADSGIEDDGRRKAEREPLPARELERRHHRQECDGHGQDDRGEEPSCQHAQGLVVMVLAGVGVRRRRQSRSVSRRFHCADELLDRNVAAGTHGRLFGGEVDGRADTVDLVQLLLDARGARSARHPLEVEPEGALLGRSRRHRVARLDGFVAGLFDRRAQRRVVESAAAYCHELRVEVDLDAVDA